MKYYPLQLLSSFCQLVQTCRCRKKGLYNLKILCVCVCMRSCISYMCSNDILLESKKFRGNEDILYPFTFILYKVNIRQQYYDCDQLK